MSRLLLQPLPARRTHQEHAGLVVGQPGLPLRGRRLSLTATLLAVAVLTGCGIGDAGRQCTMIGSLVGIGLDVEAPLAEKVTKATVEVCWDGECTTPTLTLRPSTTAEPAECSGTAPDDVCGATAVPTGDKHGFAEIPDLPAKPVRVTVTLRDATGDRVLHERITVRPKLTYPNGEECDDGAPQAQLVATDGKLRQRG